MTAIGECASQIRQRRCDPVVIERMLLAAYGDRLLEQGNRALAQALPPVGEADALEQLRSHFGLQALIVP